MIQISKDLITILPVIRLEIFRWEEAFTINNSHLKSVCKVLKNHFTYQFKILTCVSGIDYPNKKHRFQVVYELLSMMYNARTRIKVYASELTPIDSLEKVFPAASWWECEVWDMFGVFFLNHIDLRRLLTDYGFVGHPLRKDFPLIGFIEARFNVIKNRVVNEDIEFSQEYRLFEFASPWEDFKN